MTIILNGPTHAVFDKVLEEVENALTREAENSRYFVRFVDADEIEEVAEWAWERHASQSDFPCQIAVFTYDGTWDDLLDAYRGYKYDAYYG